MDDAAAMIVQTVRALVDGTEFGFPSIGNGDGKGPKSKRLLQVGRHVRSSTICLQKASGTGTNCWHPSIAMTTRASAQSCEIAAIS